MTFEMPFRLPHDRYGNPEPTDVHALRNPYRPGNGLMPPFLANRVDVQETFINALRGSSQPRNIAITGLRGVGKTVCVNACHKLARRANWSWVEAVVGDAPGERMLATRLTDVVVNQLLRRNENRWGAKAALENTPGSMTDKLRAVLEFAWNEVKADSNGIVIACDEAHFFQDDHEEKSYPLSLLLETVDFLQAKSVPVVLVLSGLPLLLTNLEDARYHCESMFRYNELNALNETESREAVLIPLETYSVAFNETTVDTILNISKGFPYFLQFVCNEMFEFYAQHGWKVNDSEIPVNQIVTKLDVDFYADAWNDLTQRQQELLKIVAQMPTAAAEFMPSEIGQQMRSTGKPFSASAVSQVLDKLIAQGVIFKTGHGKYRFAFPLFPDFVNRLLVPYGT